MFPAQKSGSAEVTDFLKILRRAFSDLRFDIQDVLYTSRLRSVHGYSFYRRHQA
jgi:hypothetical protein